MQARTLRGILAATRGLALILALAVGGEATHIIDVQGHDENLVTMVQKQQTLESDDLHKLQIEMAQLDARSAASHIPSESCRCSGAAPNGTVIAYEECRVAAECDERAIRACEMLFPGFKCVTR